MEQPSRITVRLRTQALWQRLAVMGRSQNWLAREVGISPGYLSSLVNERRAPSGAIRRRMLRALEAEDFDELFEVEHRTDAS